jgi:hypothetical protein
MNGFLDQHDIINHFPFLHKTTLIGRDERGEEGFKSVGYDLGDDFIGDIVERNGT